MSKLRPILFQDEMVRAILEGRKTQTRRVVKSIDHDLLNMMCEDIETRKPDSDRLGLTYGPSTDDDGKVLPEEWLVYCDDCPEEGVLTLGQGYGQPGDRLWVREKFATHFIWDKLPPGHIDIEVHGDCFFYGDGTIAGGCDDHQRGKWRASIHMPRFASRITLEITGVRVERLQDISGEDSAAEGAADPIGSPRAYGVVTEQFAKEQFARLWQSINGPGSWDANPWVWVVEFKRVGQEDACRE